MKTDCRSPFGGAGTNLSGGTIPLPTGAVVLTNALNKILEINQEDMYAVVQPGVVTAQLASAVEAQVFFILLIPEARLFPPLAGMWRKMPGGCEALNMALRVTT